MKVLVLAGFSKSLINFRKELLIRMVENGHEVIAVGPEGDYENEINNLGVRFVQIKFNRLATNPLEDIKLLINLTHLMRKERPDVFFGYTMKPVIYGSIAAQLAGVKRRFSMITGLGSVFIDGENKKGYIKVIVKMLYKFGLMCSNKVFFQNNDDINEFIKLGLISREKSCLVNGSGVNLEYYKPHPMPQDDIFLFVGSIMGDKGAREYMDAASIVKKDKFHARFWMVGPMDKRLSGINKEEMKRYIDDGSIEYHGETQDVRPYLKKARFYVLPSYREGTPRSVLEAMATGRPIITTDAPGCRETVIPNINGVLVPIQNVEQLAKTMVWMTDNPRKAESMGQESLRIAREKYDVNKVNKYMLKVMKLEEE